MSFRRFFSYSALALALTFGVSNNSFAQHEEGAAHSEATAHEAEDHGEAGESKKFNASEVIFGHVGDSHEWHFFSAGESHVILPLPVIAYSEAKGLQVFSSSRFGHFHPHVNAEGKTVGVTASYEGLHLERGMKEKLVADDGSKVYDFSITKNVLSMLISVILMLWIMLSVAAKYKKNGTMVAPKGMQNALEPVITFIRDEVAKPNLGHKFPRYMPLLLTIFFFIWINNMLGLLPGGANFTGNVAVTACLALISFIVMIASANKHFWGHLLNPPGVPLGIKFLLVPIEIISLFIKPVALIIRLFANILAGHIVILSVISMIFIFGGISKVAGWGFAPVSMAFTIFMFFLELMVAAIQAFIFTNLTAVFVGQAIEEAHHHDHEHEDYHPEHPLTGQEYNTSENEVIA
jgi:F-type H+-transporting ATPase subunit a